MLIAPTLIPRLRVSARPPPSTLVLWCTVSNATEVTCDRVCVCVFLRTLQQHFNIIRDIWYVALCSWQRVGFIRANEKIIRLYSYIVYIPHITGQTDRFYVIYFFRNL